MAPIALIDTHVAFWLYDGELERIPAKAKNILQSHDVSVCPIVELELSYLYEIGRLSVSATELIGDLATRIGLQVNQAPYNQVCSIATDLDWTRDPFDRLQAAQASLLNVPLVTKDELVLKNLPQAVWG